MNLQDAIKEAEIILAAEAIKQRREREKWEKGRRYREYLAATQMFPHLRPADADDYKAWLTGYVERGGIITRVQDRSINEDKFVNRGVWRSRWFVATSDVELVPLYGSTAIAIIVARGVKVSGDPGHSQLYYLDEFTTTDANVTVFSDTR